MNITLRKANALQTSIKDQLKTIEIKSSIELNEYQDWKQERENSRTKSLANDNQLKSLTKAFYEIRASVGNANSTSGIGNLLAQAAFIDKRIAQLTTLCASLPQESNDVVAGKLEKLRNASTQPSYLSRDTITANIFQHGDIDAFNSEIRALKREKQKINDQVLELNVRTEITLSQESKDLLTTLELI